MVPLFVSTVKGSSADVQLLVRTDKTTYETGELIQIYVLLLNNGPADVTLRFASACQVGFIVDDTDGNSVFNQSLPAADCFSPFNNSTNYVTVQSGQTFSFAFVWNQNSISGSLVPNSRSYMIKPFFPTLEFLPLPTTVINITSETETPIDASIDAFSRFYQSSPTFLSIIFLVAPGGIMGQRYRSILRREKWRLLVPTIAIFTGFFALYTAIISPQFFHKGYLRYPIPSLLQDLTVVSLSFMGLSILVLVLSRFHIWPRVLWATSTSALGIGYFLAVSNLSILAMEWQTFLEYNWGTSLLNGLIGYILAPLTFWLGIQIFVPRFSITPPPRGTEISQSMNP